MGYYGGDGARLITSLTPNISVSQNQPACNTNTATGLVDCGNWGVSATWNVPSTAVSGVYFAHIYRTDGTTDENQIPFVVTDNSSHSDIVFMTSDETWQAYNDWGGYSLYTGNATGSPWCCSALDPGRAVQVSYNRPFATRFDTPGGQDFFFYAEFPMIQFLEKNGYDVSYVSQIDVAQPGAASMLEQHKVLVNAGHSEYWDAGDMANVTAARNAGVNLAFFTGNTDVVEDPVGEQPVRQRALPDADHLQGEPGQRAERSRGSADLDRGVARSAVQPAGRRRAAGERADRPALEGQLLLVRGYRCRPRTPSCRFWRNTAVASLQSGQTYTMPDETLGYEWDSDVDNGFRPPGEIDMSQTCENVSQMLLTVTEEIGPGNACNSLTLYRAASGALVFDAGTVQWAWGLDIGSRRGCQNPTRPGDAAGDGQPARRHGRAAGDAGIRPGTPAAASPTPPHPPRRSPRRRPAPRSPTAAPSRSAAPPPTPAAASWRASRCPPTAARPGIR